MVSANHPSILPHNRVRLWLASEHEALPPLTPPPDQRSDSPKRRRTDNIDNIDVVQPEQSASQVALNRTDTFSLPTSRVSSSPKCSTSSTREIPILLRSAWPPVLTECINGLMEAPPEHVDRLGDWLAEGIDFGFIPQGLQHVINNDPEVGYQFTKARDFDRGDMRSAEDMLALWEDVKNILL
ncbi:hypothetical protein GQ44DRAFT_774342 [Phaeosphaeriaceae sp. PMI808]|nr:hypothetical protein GQ44DRAFT_774342 [Phaeosphaeriaceae sp. PMI808]